MAKATKKALNEALKPLFAEYDRYALGFLNMPKVAKPQAIEWRGFTIDIQLVRRSKVVCNVPFPFACFEFWYEASLDGKRIIQMGGRPSFIDAVFAYCHRNNIDLKG